MTERMISIPCALASVLMIFFLAEPSFALSGRSSKWDMMLDQIHREKRETGCDWQRKPCTLGDVTWFDKIGRRNSGLLADIANQGCCGSCWAFAATHAVTDSRSIQAGSKVDLLSAHYTIRCAADDKYYGYGCCGGYYWQALQYFRDTGTSSDTCLGYTESRSKQSWFAQYINLDKSRWQLECPARCDDKSMFEPSSFRLPDYRCYMNLSDSESDIINFLDENYLVITGMFINPMHLMSYGCGIYCLGDDQLDNIMGHAAVIVDYGTTDTNVTFWVIKNSYGSGWGESGYLRVKRGHLGIGKFPICVPLVDRSRSRSTSLPPSNLDTGTTKFGTCQGKNINNPTSDMTVMSAADFGVQRLIEGGLIQCPNGAPGNYLNHNVENATVQPVAGIVVEMTVNINIGGCNTTDVAQLMIGMIVFIDLDGNFVLEMPNIGSGSGNVQTLTLSCPLLFIVATISCWYIF